MFTVLWDRPLFVALFEEERYRRSCHGLDNALIMSLGMLSEPGAFPFIRRFMQ